LEKISPNVSLAMTFMPSNTPPHLGDMSEARLQEVGGDSG
jgi:hypothetical protein